MVPIAVRNPEVELYISQSIASPFAHSLSLDAPMRTGCMLRANKAMSWSVIGLGLFIFRESARRSHRHTCTEIPNMF